MHDEEIGVRLESILAEAKLTESFLRGAGRVGSAICFAFVGGGRKFRLDLHQIGFELFATEDRISTDPAGALRHPLIFRNGTRRWISSYCGVRRAAE